MEEEPAQPTDTPTDQDRVQAILESISPGVLVRWVLLLDHLDEEDMRTITRIQSEGSTPWEGDGMLSYALNALDIEVDEA